MAFKKTMSANENMTARTSKKERDLRFETIFEPVFHPKLRQASYHFPICFRIAVLIDEENPTCKLG